ncbi:Pex19 protein family-domain-containing protein [Infundibulicybe gibba]|nr:Pex19 protein family-domain-containing protein [Infundibulicybe gibba]
MSAPPPDKKPVDVDEEEDLDDLDDVLSQFSAPASKSQPGLGGSNLNPSTSNRPRTNTRVDAPPVSIPGSGRGFGLDTTGEVDEDALSAAFAKELEGLMREIGGGTLPGEQQSGAASGSADPEAERALKAAWEAMLVEGMGGNDGGEGPSLDQLLKGGPESESGTTQAHKAGEDASGQKSGFQNQIRQAMDKLKESETNLKADSSKATPSGGAADPELNALLSSLGDLGLGEGETDEELEGFLENMMGQLMSKEVLYEPLKELAEKFPPYLANPPAPLSDADRNRYNSQLVCVTRILAVFDEPGYDEKDPVMGKKIADLMSEMQEHGSPPAELMGPLPPGLGLGPDGMPQMGDCVVA